MRKTNFLKRSFGVILLILLLPFFLFDVQNVYASQNCFGLGSSRSVVLKVMGKPTQKKTIASLRKEIWYFGSSFVAFYNDEVCEYENYGNLKVWLGSKKSNARPFMIGSNKKKVLDVMGTPTSVKNNGDTWYYRLSYVCFRNGKVVDYDNVSDNLKVVKTSLKNSKTYHSKVSKTPNINKDTFFVYSYPLTIDYSDMFKNLSCLTTTQTINLNLFYAENGSYYGQISELTGKPKTVYVNGYFRKTGTYVRSHYRSKP